MISIKLQLDWKPNAQFAGILHAHHFGWYTNDGIDLEIIPWDDYTDTTDVLDKKEFYIASTEDNLLIKACSKGKPYVAIGTMMQYSGIGWMSLKPSKIHSIQDLRGKRIGIHNDGETAIDVALTNATMSRKDVEVVLVGYEYSDLLISGHLDAMQCLMMVEPLEMEESGHPVNVISGRSQGYSVYSQVMVINHQFIEAQQDTIIKFLRASINGWLAALKDPQQVAEVITKEYLREGDPELQAKMLEAMEPIIVGDLGAERIGWMEANRWERSIGYLEDQRILNSRVRPDDVMTNRFMEVIYR